MTLTLTLYATNADNRGPWTGVRTMTAYNVTGNSYTFYWDGKNDSGAYVDPWTYTFEVDITQTDINYNENPALQVEDATEYRSRYLHILRSRDAFNNPIYEAEYAGYDDGDPNDPNDDSYLYYIRFYDLKDTLNVDASEGELQLYDTAFNIIRTWDVASLECLASGHSGGDGLDASSVGITHDLLVPVPVSDDAGIFILHIRDDHPYKYRDHRERWARELNSFVAKVTSVVWEEINSDLDDNPKEGGGKRIYPDKQSRTDTIDRTTVQVRAKTFPKWNGMTVYFKSFDVDDPSSDSAPLDTTDEGTPPQPSGGDNRGLYSEGTMNPSNGIAITDSNGEATVDFTVSMQPGNNFRVVSTCMANSMGLHLSTSNTYTVKHIFLGNLPVNGYAMTDMLTVWRKLHVEVDSMGAEPENTTFDADDLLRGDVADPDISAFAAAFEPAYVTALRDTGCDDSNTLWHYDFLDREIMGGFFHLYCLDEEEGTRGTRVEDPAWWSVYVLGAYDGDRPEDNDPDNEMGNTGACGDDEPEWAIVFMEVERDLAIQHNWDVAEDIKITTLHEIGHQFELSDNHEQSVMGIPLNVMWSPILLEEESNLINSPTIFSAAQLAVIRGILMP